MLRSVRLKNFVRFKEYQTMDFSCGDVSSNDDISSCDDSYNNGPFIFIGENGSGKSSVLEGIRRCLKLELSTSISSVVDSDEISYFICNADVSKRKENVIFGIVTIPQTIVKNDDIEDENDKDNTVEEMDVDLTPNTPERRQSKTRKMSIDEQLPCHQIKRQRSSETESKKSQNLQVSSSTKSEFTVEGSDLAQDFKSLIENESSQNNKMRYYKFALKNSESASMLVDLIGTTKTGEGKTSLYVSKSCMVDSACLLKARQLFFNTENHSDVLNCIEDIFGDLDKSLHEPSTDLDIFLQEITKQYVFTFPLRSIGPLQWSESDRISIDYREENYKEAENRCEIIRHFLKDNGAKFDKDKEKKYFEQLTQCKEYNFELKDEKIHVPKGKFALLKTPEGILEAKAFSILISSKQFKTIILEEPDRGMHPQLIERMILIMKQEKNDKCVLLTTHQKGFITPWTIPDTFIFRRLENKSRIISGKSIFDRFKNTDNMKKRNLVTSHHVPDIFFARKVLFYEGKSEDLFLRELKKQIIIGKYGNDEEGAMRLVEYTFISMNSKDNRETYRIVSENVELDCLFLVDRDAVPKILGKKKEEIEKEDWKYIRPKLVRDERTFFWLDGDLENMVTTMCDNDIDLKHALREEKVITKTDKFDDKGVPRSQIEGKLFGHNGITSKRITEGVRLLLAHCKPEDDLAVFIKLLMGKA